MNRRSSKCFKNYSPKGKCNHYSHGRHPIQAYNTYFQNLKETGSGVLLKDKHPNPTLRHTTYPNPQYVQKTSREIKFAMKIRHERDSDHIIGHFIGILVYIAIGAAILFLAIGGAILFPIGGDEHEGPVLGLFLVFCIGSAEGDARTSLQRCKERRHNARPHPHRCTIQLVAILGAESAHAIHCRVLIRQQQTHRTRLGIHFNSPWYTYRVGLLKLYLL
jgi:hypothetical protein